jgi:tetratricopeptide (TPR) repeat protein
MHRMVGKYVEEESLEHFTHAESALRRALELNADLSSAEMIYAHLEVDMGRAEEATIRLVRRARQRSSDPELFAGLAHSSRYCGLMRASIAAADQAHRIDPRIRTSAAHTYFMLGDYARVVDYEPESVPFMRNLALMMLGRRDEALESLGSIDRSIPSRLVTYATALYELLVGNRDASVAAIRKLTNIRDPEGRYYVARQLAFLGEHAEALSLLEHVVQDGYFCLTAFAQDPWLDALRGTAEFGRIVKATETRHRQAVINFLSAEGDRVLGIPNPV